MDTFTLQRTGLPDLTFTGRLLMQEQGDDADGSTEGRVHTIEVYQADDGEYILGVRYQSPFSSEVSDSRVEALQNADEIEVALSLYDPAERLDETLFDQHAVRRKQTIAAALTKHFDRQVLNVMANMTAPELA